MKHYMPSFMLAAAFSAFAATGAMSAVITIDDFSTPQVVGDAPLVPDAPTQSEECGAGIIGGCRFMKVESSGSVPLGTSLIAQDGELSFNNGSGIQGTGWIVYAGSLDDGTWSDVGIGVNVNTSGLDNFDIAGVGPNPYFLFTVTDLDLSFETTARFDAFAWDMEGNLATYDEILGAVPFTEKLFLTQFTAEAGFSWSNIGALAFRISSSATNSDNFDGKISAITVAPIPLPAAAWLLLGGLGSLAAAGMAKRRRPS